MDDHKYQIRVVMMKFDVTGNKLKYIIKKSDHNIIMLINNALAIYIYIDENTQMIIVSISVLAIC